MPGRTPSFSILLFVYTSRVNGMGTELGGAEARLETSSGPLRLHRLAWLAEQGMASPERLPHTLKILLENLLRRAGTRDVGDDDVLELARWPAPGGSGDLAFMPGRVLMQDFTGVPAVVDLAAMRAAVGARRRLPRHRRTRSSRSTSSSTTRSRSTAFGSRSAYAANIEWEYRRNGERYALLRWAQQAFDGFRVVPPGMGICHQVNLEHLATVVAVRDGVAFPDTLVGTDSHTTMVNGLGVLGWGVGGIEAEAAMLGQPMVLPVPVVVGVRMSGALRAGTTATDLVLTLTRDAPRPWRGGEVRRVLRRRAVLARARRPGHALEHVPRVRRHLGALPGRRETLRYLAATGRGSRSTSSSATRRNRVCSAPTTTRSRRSPRPWILTSRASSRASRARSGRRTASSLPTCGPRSPRRVSGRFARRRRRRPAPSRRASRTARS